MDEPLKYPEFPALKPLLERLQEFARLKYEYGAEAGEIERTLAPALAAMQGTLAALRALPEDTKRAALEPDALEGIRALRPNVERRLWTRFDREKYADRLAGAFLGRMAGCTLEETARSMRLSTSAIFGRTPRLGRELAARCAITIKKTSKKNRPTTTAFLRPLPQAA